MSPTGAILNSEALTLVNSTLAGNKTTAYGGARMAIVDEPANDNGVSLPVRDPERAAMQASLAVERAAQRALLKNAGTNSAGGAARSASAKAAYGTSGGCCV